MGRTHNLRLIKAHRCYTAPELAETLDVCITTIRCWTQQGLKPIDDRRPYLFAPVAIVGFLESKKKPRQPLQPGEIFCVACKHARRPRGSIVELRPVTVTSGELIGVCPDCGHRIFRRVRLSELADKVATLTVQYEDAQVPIANNGDAPRTSLLEEPAP